MHIVCFVELAVMSHYFLGDPGGVVTCTITSTNIPDLTDAGGPILIGTKNVIIYCICRRSNSAAVGPTLWSHNGTGVPTANSNPFYRNNVPAPLIFASIASNHTGTYQCARQGAGQSDTADTITLTAQGMCNYNTTYFIYRKFLKLLLKSSI